MFFFLGYFLHENVTKKTRSNEKDQKSLQKLIYKIKVVTVTGFNRWARWNENFNYSCCKSFFFFKDLFWVGEFSFSGRGRFEKVLDSRRIHKFRNNQHISYFLFIFHMYRSIYFQTDLNTNPRGFHAAYHFRCQSASFEYFTSYNERLHSDLNICTRRKRFKRSLVIFI